MPWRCGDGWQRAVNLQPVCTLCVPLTNPRLHLGCSGTQAGCGQSQPVLVESSGLAFSRRAGGELLTKPAWSRVK